jgi:hypothetical protein
MNISDVSLEFEPQSTAPLAIRQSIFLLVGINTDSKVKVKLSL